MKHQLRRRKNDVLRSLGLVVLLSWGGPVVRADEPVSATDPVEISVPHLLDSGFLGNDSDEYLVVFDTVIDTPNAAWSRLYFSSIDLSGRGFVRFTGLADGEEQFLDSAGTANWKNCSAYFNGSRVRVEVFAAPDTFRNRVVLDHVGVQFPSEAICPVGPCGPCVPDERLLTNNDWSGRFLPAGCGATVYNDQGCAVTAGGCFVATGSSVLMFRVPLSLSTCPVQMSAVADQFPIISAISSGSTQVGNDWQVIRLGTNSAGFTHFQRYGVFMPIASPASPTVPVSDPLDFYAFGNTANPATNHVQQQSHGLVKSVTPTYYQTGGSTTGGTAGAGLIYTDPVRGEELVGVLTHCGACEAYGTRADLPEFIQARAQLCPPPTCAAPPSDMTGWWPGDNTPEDIAGALDGTLQGATTYAAGKVGSSAFSFVSFTSDRVTIVHNGQLDPGAGDYTFDAWVKAGNGQIVTLPGAFDAYITQTLCTSCPNSFFLFVNFVLPIPQTIAHIGLTSISGTWVHLAFTIDRSSNLLTLYVNGQPTTQQPISPTLGSIVGTGPVSLGSDGQLPFPSSPVTSLDEVEIFRRALSPDEILEIYNAGALGKCRDVCHVPWDASICPGDPSVTVTLDVCNYDLVSHNYFLSFTGVPSQGPGSKCPLAGPTGFTVVGGPTVSVGPGQCVPVQVVIQSPPGLGQGQVSCYDLTMTNLENGDTSICHGSIQGNTNVCFVGPGGGCCPSTLAIRPFEPAMTSVSMLNLSLTSGLIPYRIEAHGPDMLISRSISLGGREPGQPLTGMLAVPVGSVGTLDFEVKYLAHEAFGFSDIVVLVDQGTGGYTPLTSIGARSIPRSAPCTADLNLDSQVDFADYLEFLNLFEAQDLRVDFNGDGVIDFADYMEFLNHYEVGC